MKNTVIELIKKFHIDETVTQLRSDFSYTDYITANSDTYEYGDQSEDTVIKGHKDMLSKKYPGQYRTISIKSKAKEIGKKRHLPMNYDAFADSTIGDIIITGPDGSHLYLDSKCTNTNVGGSISVPSPYHFGNPDLSMSLIERLKEDYGYNHLSEIGNQLYILYNKDFKKVYVFKADAVAKVFDKLKRYTKKDKAYVTLYTSKGWPSPPKTPNPVFTEDKFNKYRDGEPAQTYKGLLDCGYLLENVDYTIL